MSENNGIEEGTTAQCLLEAIKQTDALIEKIKGNGPEVSNLIGQRNILVGAMHLLAQGEALGGALRWERK